jgi:ABC-type multidrug transport system ATPase subunit
VNKLKLNLENCYGISKLEFEFDLAAKGKSKGVYSIYAPNGSMKSSFARTFQDIQLGLSSRDIIFSERETVSDISIDDTDLNAENVFVVTPYSESFKSEKTSLLLVNEALKKQYDSALREIENRKKELFKFLKDLTGINSRTISIEAMLCKAFDKTEKDLFELLTELLKETNDYLHFSEISYGDVFNEKVINLLESGEIGKELEDYIQTYDELVEKSPVLSRSFNHQNAASITKNLKDTGFFDANHTVNLAFGKEKHEVKSQKELIKIIEAEQNKVITNPELLKKFSAIDKKLSNAETKRFREYITDNKALLSELADWKAFEKKVWIGCLQKGLSLHQECVATYQTNKQLVIDITQTAKDQQTTWELVVATFNKRFNVPFKLKIENQEDVILQSAQPTIAFDFNDGRGNKNVNKNELLDVLSQGEKRALYILNLLFEIEVRLQQATATLFIIDDIADSFDYKNKYSIVEYLRDISDISYFKVIFLTHNFDFHRTICGRIGIYGNKRLFAIKTENGVKLIQEKYQRDVLNYWKTQLKSDDKCVLACIPFARNLAEYCGNKPEYNKLTALLHIKPDTGGLCVADLQKIYRSVFTDQNDVQLNSLDVLIVDLLTQVSNQIVEEANDEAQLEDKIVVSIAIRLEAERFMIEKINDQDFVDNIEKNQTQKLYERYCNDFGDENESIMALDQVNLMTPENIHLNSFMYEPILDISAMHLYRLYEQIKNLN